MRVKHKGPQALAEDDNPRHPGETLLYATDSHPRPLEEANLQKIDAALKLVFSLN